MKNKDWTSTIRMMPPEGVQVETKIDDSKGCRNEALLTRRGNLWFCSDGTYVYYIPTHWRIHILN